MSHVTSWALIVVDSVLPDNNGRRLLSPHHNAAELAATEDKSVQFSRKGHVLNLQTK